MFETLKITWHIAVEERDSDTRVDREPAVLPGEHVGSGRGVEQAGESESADHAAADSLGERGQIGRGDWPELNDGRVVLNVRSESKAHRRLVTTSQHGTTGWRTPKFDDALLEPICMGGIVRYTHDGQSLTLFSNPHTLDEEKNKAEPGKNRDRKNVSIKVSRNEGETWPVNKTLEAGPSMYSDLAVTHDGTILCFDGRSGDGSRVAALAGGRLTLARFNLEWLEQP